MLQSTPSGPANGCTSQGHETWLLGAQQIIADDMHTELEARTCGTACGLQAGAEASSVATDSHKSRGAPGPV